MVLQAQPVQPKQAITWEPLPGDFVLPDDPVENIQQPLLAAALTDALGAAAKIQPEMLIVSNFALVATVNQKTVVKAPDWLYVSRVNPVLAGVVRRSYTPHLEGATVAVVMEFLSDEDGGELSIRSTPPYGKFYFYEQILQVPTYVTYDPYEVKLEVRSLQNGQYILQTPDDQGRLWIAELELFLGIWFGERLGQTMNWLRWWDADGNLLLWSTEQAEQERQRAEAERQQAEQRVVQAESELEAERQRVTQLAERLRALGVDLDEA